VSIPVLAQLVALIVGLSVIWSNPRRRINQAFTLASVWVAFWLFLLWVLNQPHLEHPVPWLKAISAVGACFPCLLWWIGECAVDPDVRWSDFVRRGGRWLLLALVLGSLALSDWFIPAQSTPEHPLRGYPVYVLGLVVSYLLLVVQALLRMRRLTGIQLVEVQTLLVGGALSGLAGLAMTAVPPLLGLPSAAGIAPVAVLFFYALTAWSITNRRIFDARQFFLSVFRRATVLTAATALLYAWLDLATGVVPAGISLLVGLTVAVWLVIWTERRVTGPQFSGQARATERMRATVLEAGRDEVDPEALQSRYAALLCEWGRTDRAEIRPAAELTGGGPDGGPALGEAAAAQLVAERWATPESLSRRRVTPPVEEVESYLSRRQLGLVVVSPRVRGSDPIALALGRRSDGMPYLWPEVRDLLDCSELMEVALARAQLTRRARETEQVATAGLLGANLAHEIRNPLVALKTFAQLLPERHHDP
jgi:signal transduction histidine kinase